MADIKNDLDLWNIVSEADRIIIYGCGAVGKKIQNKLIKMGINNFCFSVSDEVQKSGREVVLGTPVYEIKEIPERITEKSVVLISVSELLLPELEKKCEEVCIENRYRISPQYTRVLLEESRENLLEDIYKSINQIQTKLSMRNDIWHNGNLKFYVPYYPSDFISRVIVDENKFFEEDILKELDRYIPDEAVIVDVGANIGNHCIYWAKRRNVRKIYAFEPVKDTYDILLKNIKLNGIDDIVFPYNYGTSDHAERAGYSSYRIQNIGDTHLQPLPDGEMQLIRLDEFLKDIPEINFIKIDVEDYEVKTLIGMEKLFMVSQPYVFIESYPDYYEKANLLMETYNYKMIRQFPHHNFLYKYQGNNNE